MAKNNEFERARIERNLNLQVYRATFEDDMNGVRIPYGLCLNPDAFGPGFVIEPVKDAMVVQSHTLSGAQAFRDRLHRCGVGREKLGIDTDGSEVFVLWIPTKDPDNAETADRDTPRS